MKLTKIGSNRGKPRVWLQGAVLKEAGFKKGMKFTAQILPGELLIELDKDGDRHVSGKPGIAIIDIATSKLLELGPIGTSLLIYNKTQGTIRLVPAKEQERGKAA